MPIDPVDPETQAAFRQTDCFDLLLLELADLPHVARLAQQWRSDRTASGLPVVHAFDGRDAMTDAYYHLLEALLRFTKLRVELSAVSASSKASLDLALATGHGNKGYGHARQAMIEAFEAHVAAHGVGLAPGER